MSDVQPRPPLAVRADEILIYPSVKSMLRDLEPHNVRRQPWTAYDREGRVFELRWKDGQGILGPPSMEIVSRGRTSLVELREVLSQFLEDRSIEAVPDLCQVWLDCLCVSD